MNKKEIKEELKKAIARREAAEFALTVSRKHEQSLQADLVEENTHANYDQDLTRSEIFRKVTLLLSQSPLITEETEEIRPLLLRNYSLSPWKYSILLGLVQSVGGKMMVKLIETPTENVVIYCLIGKGNEVDILDKFNQICEIIKPHRDKEALSLHVARMIRGKR